MESPITEVKENGLPEEPSNENTKTETEQVNGDVEKTPEKEAPTQKIEETSEQKKKKEKKKKWSFRWVD